MKKKDSAMHMQDDPALVELLSDVIKKEGITHGVETGTYLGLGSTTMIAEALRKNSRPDNFVTLEANWRSWTKARVNLRKFPFVRSVWGKSLHVADSIAFIKDDDAIMNHAAYDDVYIDNIEDPVKFYSDEMEGRLGGDIPKNPLKKLKYLTDKSLNYEGEDLLRKYLMQFKEQNPLIVLDSAGGVGFMEWTVTKEVMGGSPYIVLLDDTHHLKHFRSIKEIAERDDFVVLG